MCLYKASCRIITFECCLIPVVRNRSMAVSTGKSNFHFRLFHPVFTALTTVNVIFRGNWSQLLFTINTECLCLLIAFISDICTCSYLLLALENVFYDFKTLEFSTQSYYSLKMKVQAAGSWGLSLTRVLIMWLVEFSVRATHISQVMIEVTVTAW